MAQTFFYKKSASLADRSSKGSGFKSAIKQNKQLKAKEWHKTITKKIGMQRYIHHLKAADLADMQVISKFNKGIPFLSCVIDIFSKYACVVLVKDKKETRITNDFQKNLNESNGKRNKIWVNKGSEFYHRSMKSWLEKNGTEMYSTNNERKSVVAQRFINTLKTKIYEYMTSISKNAYINKLDGLVNKNSNTFHRTIKMKPVDVKDNRYIDFDQQINDKDPKFKVGDYIRILKYKNISAKGYGQN